MIDFSKVKEDDLVIRNLGGVLIPLVVTKIENGLIHAQPREKELQQFELWMKLTGQTVEDGDNIQWYTFDQETGHEIDEQLGWKVNQSGSYLVEIITT